MDNRVIRTIIVKTMKYSRVAWALFLFFVLKHFLKVMIKSPIKKPKTSSAFGNPANVLAFNPEAKRENYLSGEHRSVALRSDPLIALPFRCRLLHLKYNI